MSETRVAELAARLGDARQTGRPIARIDASLRPTDVTEAYSVQRATQVRRGAGAAGYKLALTSAGAQRAFGSDSPVVGALAPEDVLWSPATLQADGLPWFAEAEVVFAIREALDPAKAPFSADAVRECIASAHVGIEICSSRYGWDDVSLPELVADNANARSLVIGPAIMNWRDADLTNTPVTLRRRGRPDVEGSTSAVLGGPFLALTWLANWLARSNSQLAPGDVVASGSCTGVTELGVDEDIVVDFGALGRARAIIKPGNGSGRRT